MSMSIHSSPKEKAAGGLHTTTATAINTLDFSTTQRSDKVFSTFQSASAFKGHAMPCTDPAVGPVTYWAERWGLVRYLPTIDTARQFLEQIGGRL